MNLKELNYIVTIADEGSISRAAEKLYMAQSSLSQFLQLYEAELGAPLFMRTSRGVRPTASGSVFLNHARQILLQYHRAQSELWDIEELSGGRIELGISTFRGTYLLPPVLKRFRDLYPRIHVEITEKDSMYLEEMILEGFLDMALLALPSPRLHKQLDFLTRDEIYLVTVSEHPVMEFVHREEDGTRCRSEGHRPVRVYPGTAKDHPGSMIRKAFEDLHLEPLAQNTNITAPFAAAMAREGIALSFTYHSCMVKAPGVEYLSVGRKGLFLDLSLAIPPANTAPRPPWPWQRCSMRFIRSVHPAIGQGICPALRPAFRPAASGQASWDGFPGSRGPSSGLWARSFCLYAISGALPLRWDLPGSQTSLYTTSIIFSSGGFKLWIK